MGDKNGFRFTDLILGSRDRTATTESFAARRIQLGGFAQNPPAAAIMCSTGLKPCRGSILRAKPLVHRSAARNKLTVANDRTTKTGVCGAIVAHARHAPRLRVLPTPF
jgi:hypothetical protein